MSMNPPEQFVDEYWKMRERMDWAETAVGQGQDLAQGKSVLEEFRSFYDRWRHLITEPEICEGLDHIREHMEQNLGRELERIYLKHLQEVIEARKDWWQSELLFQASIEFIGLMKHAPAKMRSELEKIHREHMERDFDPETEYREAEADANESESKFRNTLAALEVDWPERLNPALRERLQKLDGVGANDWQAELQGALAKLDAKE